MYIKYTMYIKVYTIEPYLKTNNTSSKKKKTTHHKNAYLLLSYKDYLI